MAQAPNDWWSQFGEKYGPGLLGIGANVAGDLYTGRQQNKLLNQFRGPNYATEQALAGRSLALAAIRPRAQVSVSRPLSTRMAVA